MLSSRRLAARALAPSVVSLGLLVSGCGTQTAVTDDAAGDTPTSTASTSAEVTTPEAETSPSSGAASRKAPTGAGAGAATPPVYDFTARTVAGAELDGADLAGSPTVLWFWAPWCPTCLAQIEGVGSLAETYGDVDVVGVGSLDDTAAIEAFAADVSPEVTMLDDADGAVWRHFGVTAQSTYVVVDTDGEVVASGSMSDAELAGAVDDLVG